MPDTYRRITRARRKLTDNVCHDCGSDFIVTSLEARTGSSRMVLEGLEGVDFEDVPGQK